MKCFPCVATFVAIGKETGSYRWVLFDALYTTIVAWIVSVLAYYLTALLIWGLRIGGFSTAVPLRSPFVTEYTLVPCIRGNN